MRIKENAKYLWYFSIIILSLILIIKFIQLSKMIYFYPSYDFSSHIANLFFLKEYGFHGISPNWYNGLVVLRYYPPLLFFYSYIFYSFINNIQLAFYISLIGIIILGFFGINLLGKALNFSVEKRLFLFLFFYANPITIPWFYNIGRIPEMFAWTLSFYLFALLFYYRKNELNKKFFIFLTLILTLILLAHILVLILSLFLVLGFFFTRNNKEKTIMTLSLILVPILSSFWLLDFIKHMGTLNYVPSYRLNIHQTEIIYSILIPIIFLIILYLYKKIKRIDKKEFLFYIPLILISIAYLTHLFLYIPILKNIEPRTYGILLMTISMILFLSLKPKKKAFTLISIGILILSIAIASIVTIRYNQIDFPLYSEREIGTINLIPLIKEKFIAIGKEGNANKRHIYAYGAVKYNTTTPLGWDILQASKEVKSIENEIKESINNKECKKFEEVIKRLEVKEILSHKDKCDFIETCNFIKIEVSNQYCLLHIKD